MNILRYFLPSVGRLSPADTVDLSMDVSIGYIGIGPIIVLFELPERFQKKDPAPLSVAELNALNRMFDEIWTNLPAH